MLRCTFRTAAALLAGGVLLCVRHCRFGPATRGSRGLPSKAKASRSPPRQGRGRAKGRRSGKGRAAGSRPRRSSEYKEAAAKLSSSAGAAECVWTGRRIASLLWRDDIDTARRYIDLYDRFGCSSEHLKLAFRCVIQQGPIDPKAADRLASRVHACWIAPEETNHRREPSDVGTTTRTGTIPN